MAKKKIKLNTQLDSKSFSEHKKNLSEELQALLDTFAINSFEDLHNFFVMMGYDVEKMHDFYDKNGEDAIPTPEDIMFDEDDPRGDISRTINNIKSQLSGNGDLESEEGDPFVLPEKIFFDEKPVYAYHLRVKLNKSPLPIWREIEVPSNISLEFLAFVLIEAMGWENTHLHQFSYKNIIYQNKVCMNYNDDYMPMGFSRIQIMSSEDYSISEIFKEKGDKIHFEYDFGDSWMHDVWLKGIREYGENEEKCINILKGKGFCPPEDCGGVYGYEDILEVFKKKRKTAEEKDMLEWYDIDKDYDPEYFDIIFAQERLDDLWSEVN